MDRRRKDSMMTWPEIDRQLFAVGLKRSSRRTDRRSPTTLAQTTIQNIKWEYGRSLAWLAHHQQLDLVQRPHQRWSLELADQMVEELFDGGKSVATVLTRLNRTKSALSIMEPSANLTLFDQLAREIGPPHRNRDPRALELTSWEVQEFGISLMERAEESEAMDLLQRAYLYQTGAQIALLAARPWRPGAFFAMEIGVNIRTELSSYRLVSLSHQTKQRRQHTGTVPIRLKHAMDDLLVKWRPILMQGSISQTALWLNLKAGRQSDRVFWKQSRALTIERFGFSVTPQVIRRIAATTIAIHNPRKVQSIQGVLGHANAAIGEEHYNQANSVLALDALDQCIDDLAKVAKERRRLSKGRSKG